MSDLIEFKLVSPEAELVSKPVKMAVMPGDLGEFGVGKNHTALVSHLQVGVVRLYPTSKDDTPERIFITGGFADVTNDVCVVLAEEAINVDELDGDTLSAELKNLQHDLELAVEEGDKIRYQAQINIVNAKLRAVAA